MVYISETTRTILLSFAQFMVLALTQDSEGSARKRPSYGFVNVRNDCTNLSPEMAIYGYNSHIWKTARTTLIAFAQLVFLVLTNYFLQDSSVSKRYNRAFAYLYVTYLAVKNKQQSGGHGSSRIPNVVHSPCPHLHRKLPIPSGP